MSGALVLALAIGSALVLAVVLARLPMDRAPEEMVEWWPFVPAAPRVTGYISVTEWAPGATISWSIVGDQMVWNHWVPDYEPALLRWADDGGPA